MASYRTVSAEKAATYANLLIEFLDTIEARLAEHPGSIQRIHHDELSQQLQTYAAGVLALEAADRMANPIRPKRS